MCLEFPGQNRYIISFPLICSHMQACTHEICPEEVSNWHSYYTILDTSYCIVLYRV